MNHSHAPNRGRIMSPIVLATACAALASACAGEYPLGEGSEISRPLEGGDTSPAGVGASPLPAWLAPPELTIAGVFGTPGPGTLATAGDLDGDGRDEMVLSGVDSGLEVAFVQVRYGGARPNDDAEKFAFVHGGAFLTLPNDSWIEPAVTAAGDVDGDGYGDLLVRTEDCDTTGPYEGSYLVYGGPERLEGSVPLASVATRFVPSARGANPPPGYGLSCQGAEPLAPAGDIDGDGFDDLVIEREPMLDTSNGSVIFGTGEGVYVFYGRPERFASEVPLESADATFRITESIEAFPYGDVDGDGLADLVLSPDAYRAPPPGSFLLRGRGERWSGTLGLADNATVLAGAYVTTAGWLNTPGDLDGDGLTEILLFDADFGRHLFYGAPGLFTDGVDFGEADATIGDTAGYVYSVGDRDGDGDDELLDQFTSPGATGLDSLLSNIAFTSGSRERLSGTVPFPEAEVTAQFPEGPFPDQRSNFDEWGRGLRYAIPAGDLDGDGADDLFTTSISYQDLSYSQDGSSIGYSTSDPQIHIHYGVPGQAEVVVR